RPLEIRLVDRRVDLEEELALLDQIAFAHGNPRDAARDVGADVHLLLGLNLPAGGDRRDEVAPAHGLEAHLDALVALRAGTHHHQHNQEHGPSTSQQHLVPLRHGGLILSVNASCGPRLLLTPPGPCCNRTSRSRQRFRHGARRPARPAARRMCPSRRGSARSPAAAARGQHSDSYLASRQSGTPSAASETPGSLRSAPPGPALAPTPRDSRAGPALLRHAAAAKSL